MYLASPDTSHLGWESRRWFSCNAPQQSRRRSKQPQLEWVGGSGPFHESPLLVVARSSSQRTGLHGRTLLKRFLGLFSGRIASLRVCSVPTELKICVTDDTVCWDWDKGQRKTNETVPLLYTYTLIYFHNKQHTTRNKRPTAQHTPPTSVVTPQSHMLPLRV